MRSDEPALETCDESVWFCAWSSSCCLLRLPTLMFDAEHRDVQRDDAGEQHGERRDPEDAAGEPQPLRTAARTRARARLGARSADGATGGAATSVANQSTAATTPPPRS